MSVDITGYTEALINGEWHCIDFYQYDSKGKLHLIPSIQGRSLVSYALEEESRKNRDIVCTVKITFEPWKPKAV